MTQTAIAKIETNTGLRRLTSDGWENVTSGTGTRRDRRFANRIRAVAPSVDRQKFEDLYFGDDMAAKIVDVPVEDMVREWFTVSVDELDEPEEGERGAVTKRAVEIADGVLQFLDDLGAKRNVTEALTWAKVFGGGALFLGIDDQNENLFEPLAEERIKSFDFLTAFDRWEIEIFRTYAEPSHPKFGEPEVYRLISNSGTRGGAVKPEELVHETRILRFNGVMTNRRRKRRNDGWDDPVYVRTEEVLGDFGISWAGAAHLLSDFAQAIFKMKGLGDAIASQEGSLVLERMLIMDTCRSTTRMIPIDADDEDFIRSATPMSGLPETLDRFMLRLSAAARMPVTLLFGQSPAGLNTTAEGDLAFWYQRIGAMQETDLRGPLERLVELVFRSPNGPTDGKEPDGWALKFNPLDRPTKEQEATVRKTTAETDQMYIDTGVLDVEEVRQSRFGGETYSTETMIDADRDLGRDPEPDDLEAMVRATAAEPISGGVTSEVDPVVAPAEALNGAQVTALVDLVKAVSSGELTFESALEIMITAFPIDEARARRILAGAEDLAPPREPPNPFDQPEPEPRGDASHPATPRRRSSDDGICDRDSPNYDAKKCAERKRRRERNDRIEKRGSEYVVLAKGTREVLGTHPNRAAALRQLAAVEADK